MLKGEGSIKSSVKSGTGILYIPSHIMLDSAFPLDVPAKVLIRIEGERLIVEKVKQ